MIKTVTCIVCKEDFLAGTFYAEGGRAVCMKCEHRKATEPRRQVKGIMSANTLALIIGRENFDRMLDEKKNRRKTKEQRKK